MCYTAPCPSEMRQTTGRFSVCLVVTPGREEPMFNMRRRTFITLLGGAAAWPLTARAQPAEKMRHIGVLVPVAEANPVGQARLGAFLQGLQQLGWADGRNVRIDI